VPNLSRRKHIVVCGSGYAGLTAAAALKDLVRDEHDVTVVSKDRRFVDTRSLVWLPFGLRRKEDICFDVGEPLTDQGIRFRHAEVTRISVDQRSVVTKSGSLTYDYLLIATGSRPNHAAIPGLGPRGYTQSISTLTEAEQARATFDRFVQNPGPVVVGAAQGATLVGCEREFLLTMAHQLAQRGLAERASLTYLGVNATSTSSASPAHASDARRHLFGQLGVRTVADAAIARIEPEAIHLSDGRVLPFAYAMLRSPVLGADVIRACRAVSDAEGFVQVNALLQSPTFPDVFAAGSAVTMHRPILGYPSGGARAASEVCGGMAMTAARNLVAHMTGASLTPFS
jgi:sulfide:quinone oxidoreductase